MQKNKKKEKEPKLKTIAARILSLVGLNVCTTIRCKAISYHRFLHQYIISLLSEIYLFHASLLEPFFRSDMCKIALIQSCTPNQSSHLLLHSKKTHADTCTHISCTKHRFNAVIISFTLTRKITICDSFNNYDQRQSHGYLSKTLDRFGFLLSNTGLKCCRRKTNRHSCILW